MCVRTPVQGEIAILDEVAWLTLRQYKVVANADYIKRQIVDTVKYV